MEVVEYVTVVNRLPHLPTITKYGHI